MQLLFIVLLFFKVYSEVHLTNSQISEETIGEDFTEKFDSKSDLWHDAFGELQCLETYLAKNKKKCVWKTSENNLYMKAPPTMNNLTRHEVDLHFRNDCIGPKCCDGHSNYCTTMSAGQLTSTHVYHFGTYRFFAQTIAIDDNLADKCAPEPFCFQEAWKFKKCEIWAQNGKCRTNPAYMLKCCKTSCGCGLKDNTMEDVLTCFMLENTHVRTAADTAVGICIPSIEPNTANIILQNDGKAMGLKYAMHFNSAKQTTSYRIDWRPDSMKLYVNGIMMHQMKEAEISIPQHPLHIKVFVMPRHRQNFIETSPNPVDLFTRVFKIQYRALFTTTTTKPTTTAIFGSNAWWEDPYFGEESNWYNDHTELFVSGRIFPNGFKCFLFIVFIILLICFIFSFICTKYNIFLDRKCHMQGDYLLIQDI